MKKERKEEKEAGGDRLRDQIHFIEDHTGRGRGREGGRREEGKGKREKGRRKEVKGTRVGNFGIRGQIRSQQIYHVRLFR
jgi:hypothetical protein